MSILLENLSLSEVGEVAKEITGRVVESVNESEIAEGISQGFIKSLPDNILNKLAFFIDIGKILLIIMVIYFVLKIFKFILNFNDGFRFKVAVKNIKEINRKMDFILDSLRLKKDKNNKEEDKYSNKKK